MNETEPLIRQALTEVGILIEGAFAEVGGSPVPGSALDQAGLIDGVGIVEDYLQHNEAGVALEHLIYMIQEPALSISAETFQLIERAARVLGIESDLVERIRP